MLSMGNTLLFLEKFLGDSLQPNTLHSVIFFKLNNFITFYELV